MHVLDRPIYHALTTRQAAFARSIGSARRFVADVSPFAACADDSEDALRDLAAIVPQQGNIILLQSTQPPVPAGLEIEFQAEGVQMVSEFLPPIPQAENVDELGEPDAPAMLELATLTKPGPFLARTHTLGGFVGIRVGGTLVAMAGERLKVPGFTEVSGVCTRPGHRGKGYAALLSTLVAHRIHARGETPFLHAFAANTGAIRIYEALGFKVRTRVWPTALKRS